MVKKLTDMTTPLLIIRIVFDYFGIDLIMQKLDTRKSEKVKACQVAMYFLSYFTQHTHRVIAGYFNRDHATFNHSIKTVNNMIDTDKHYRQDINNIKVRILSRLAEDDFKYSNYETDNV